jgi:predicted phosphodiesterase
MANRRTIKGNIVCEYLQKHQNMPSKTLAKLICIEEPKVFPTLENARDRIRYYRGKMGDRNRKKALGSEFVKTEDAPYNPFNALPEGLKHFEEWEPFVIKQRNILMLFDIHIPYHALTPLKIALEYGYKHGVDCIFLGGDVVDHYALSFWEKDPRKRFLKEELETTLNVLGVIRDAFPGAKIIWLKGNHEERYDRIMRVQAPIFLGIKNFDFSNVYELDRLDIELVENKRIVKIGDLNCVHGHEFGRSISSPVNPARGLFLRGKEISTAGHWHQTSHHSEKSMTGYITSCWSSGCLCDLRPDWLPINKWNHGFQHVTLDGDMFHLANKKIVKNNVFSA